MYKTSVYTIVNSNI